MGDYIPPEFSPVASIVAMHNTPRITGVNNYDLADEAYKEGLYFIAAPYFMVALAALCVFPISVFVRNTCPKTQSQQKVMSRHEKRRIFELRRATYMLFWFLTVAGCITAFMGNEVADSGENLAKDAMHTSASVLNAAGSSVSLASTNTNQALSDLGVIAAGCPSVDFTLVTADISGILDSLDGWLAALGDAGSWLSGLLELDDDVRYPWTVGILDATVVLFALAVLSLVFINTRCAFHPIIIKLGLSIGSVLIPFSILLLIAVWCVTGIGMVLAVGSADFCMDPDANSILTAVFYNDSAVVAVTKYYIECPADGTGLDSLANDGALLAGHAVDDLAGLRAAVDSNCNSYLSSFDEVSAALRDAQSTFAQVSSDVRCEVLNTYYIDFRHSACDRWAVGIIITWSGLLLLSIFLFAQAVASPDGDQRKNEAAIQVI